MPTSRNRKKKSKQPKRATEKESVLIDGIRFTREGNMTYIHNERTAEEQEAFLKEITGQQPAFKAYLDDLTRQIIAVFTEYDPLVLLGGLASYTILQERIQQDGLAEQILEQAQSIATGIPSGSKTKQPTDAVMKKLIRLLDDRLQYSLRYYTHESIIYKTQHPDANPVLTDLRHSVITERLVIRGTGYYTHVEELFIDLFSLHDDKIKTAYGFTAREMTEALHQFEEALALKQDSLHGMPNMRLMHRLNKWMLDNHIFPPVLTAGNYQKFKDDNPDIHSEPNRIITYNMMDLVTIKDLYLLRPYTQLQEKVIEALALDLSSNTAYLEGDKAGDPINDSLVRDQPIVRDGINSYLFSYSLPSRNFLRIGQRLLKQADKAYYEKEYLGKKYMKSRDNFFERKVLGQFETMLKEVKFVPNVSYPMLNGTTELDILGIGEDEYYLVEIKAGELNEDARMGGLGNLTSRLKKNVGEGAYQSDRAARFIHEHEQPIFTDTKGNPIVADKNKKIYRIVVTLDNFAGILSKYTALEETKMVAPSADFPWVVQIYDLMIFAELLTNKNDFNDFLDKRLALNSWDAFTSNDEIYFLGHFLESDLVFEDEKKELDFFTLDNHNQDIDAYFYARQRGQPAEKPVRKKAAKN